MRDYRTPHDFAKRTQPAYSRADERLLMHLLFWIGLFFGVALTAASFLLWG